MAKVEKGKRAKKKKYEKPVSLYGFSFDEVVAKIVKTKAPKTKKRK
jgi:hypothetical protein